MYFVICMLFLAWMLLVHAETSYTTTLAMGEDGYPMMNLREVQEIDFSPSMIALHSESALRCRGAYCNVYLIRWISCMRTYPQEWNCSAKDLPSSVHLVNTKIHCEAQDEGVEDPAEWVIQGSCVLTYSLDVSEAKQNDMLLLMWALMFFVGSALLVSVYFYFFPRQTLMERKREALGFRALPEKSQDAFLEHLNARRNNRYETVFEGYGKM